MIAIAIQQIGDRNAYRICSYLIAMYDVSPMFLMPEVRAYLGEKEVNQDVLESIALSGMSNTPMNFTRAEMPKPRKTVSRKPTASQRIHFMRDQESAG